MRGKVWIVGAGPGAPDLLTVRAVQLIEQADLIIYTDSLLDERILRSVKPSARVHGSASMTLEEIVRLIEEAVSRGETVVRLQSGDPSVFGAVLELLRALKAREIHYEIVPGVSAAFAAAAALGIELTVPEVAQAVILARAGVRTPVPSGQELRELARHGATMVLYLSAGLLDVVVGECLAGGYPPDTPAAIVYRASWPDQKIVRTNLAKLVESAKREGIVSHAVVVVGQAVGDAVWGESLRSKLYSPEFAHSYRRPEQSGQPSDPHELRMPGPGEIVPCNLDGRDLVLLWHCGSLLAISRWCPHRGGDFSRGFVLGDRLVCADHGWSFRLEDGSPASSGTRGQIEIFDVISEGGEWRLIRRSR